MTGLFYFLISNSAYDLVNNPGKSYNGRCDIFDFRPDGSRGFGSLASLRVMQATHQEPQRIVRQSGIVMGPKHEEVIEFAPTYQYVVLEPVQTNLGLPIARLVAATHHSKSALKGGKSASGGLVRDGAIWLKHLTSSSRTGAHGGGTVVALVDNLNSVSVQQDHLVLRYELTEEVIDEEGFRVPNGSLTPSVFVPGADMNLVEMVRNQGFLAKVGGEATFIGLNETDEGWLLPDGLPENYVLRLEAAEAGGGATNTGHALIVCGHHGEPLRPFGTSGHRGQQSCGTHAWFGLNGGLVTVSASWWSKGDPTTTVTITRHTLSVSGNVVAIVSEQLWSGSPGKLPGSLLQFHAAVNAAHSKATDYHCRSIHYALASSTST